MGDGKKKYESFEELYASAHRLVYLFIRDYTNDWYTAEEISSIFSTFQCGEIKYSKNSPHMEVCWIEDREE